MSRPAPTAIAAALAAVLVTAAAAASAPLSITLYRSGNSALYSNGQGDVDAGYATIHELRTLELENGTQMVVIDDLPTAIDSEALNLGFEPSAGIEVLSQRLLWPGNAAVSAYVGKKVTVLGSDGHHLAEGTLLAAGSGTLTVADPARGTVVVYDFAAIAVPGAQVHNGARLQVTLDAPRAGAAPAQLSYVTAGLGWRAAYTGILAGGNDCQLAFHADASIANRSGRDWHEATLKLVAGEPHFAKPSAPRPMMAMRAKASYAAAAPPEQASMGDYRSYTLAQPITLPDGSVTQVPLYEARTLACERSWLYENGGTWSPPKPMLRRDYNQGSSEISSHLKFKAFEALPAGYLRVLGSFNGQREFLGSARISDTPQGQPVEVTLGQAFDLRGNRERTEFKLDKAANTLVESWRITLSNGGDTARTVTVREHPNRWRNWTLVSSSSKPVAQSTDTLDFAVQVPAHGKADLEYSVRYQWTDADE